MVDSTNVAYSFKGDVTHLHASVLKSCDKMGIPIKDTNFDKTGFTVVAAQKTNWLSTNWPVKFKITAEQTGESYVLLIQGSSSMGSLTQSANNVSKAQELLSLIKAFAPTN